jgi:hypothetical protein
LESLPVYASDGFVPSNARMHKSLFWPAIWAIALRAAVGGPDRNKAANHIG